MKPSGTIRFNLDALLKAREWSAYRLAKESGVQETIIGKYRNNAVQAPPLDTLAKLCGALGCGIGELMEYVPDKQTRTSRTTTAAKPRAKKR